MKIIAVTHAVGVDFLIDGTKRNPDNILVDSLAERGVVFNVCETTLKGHKPEKNQFIPETRFVSSGVAEIAKLQYRGGFASIKP